MVIVYYFIKRTFIFKWLAALALELDHTKLKDHLKFIIPILQREIIIGETGILTMNYLALIYLG